MSYWFNHKDTPEVYSLYLDSMWNRIKRRELQSDQIEWRLVGTSGGASPTGGGRRNEAKLRIEGNTLNLAGKALRGPRRPLKRSELAADRKQAGRARARAWCVLARMGACVPIPRSALEGAQLMKLLQQLWKLLRQPPKLLQHLLKQLQQLLTYLQQRLELYC